MKKAWNSISTFGVGFAQSKHERKSVLLINRMSVVLVGMFLFFCGVGVLQKLYDIFFFAIPFGLFFCGIPLLQRSGRLVLARYLFCFLPPLCVTAIALFNGMQMGDRFFFLVTASVPLIVLKGKTETFIIFLLNVFLFFFAEWYQSTHAPVKLLPLDLQKQYWYVTILGVFAILYFVIRYFRSDNEAYEKELELKNDEISEKNKDILSSIHYAKRIQRALLASDTLLENKLPEHFLLYKPKDIVSGDFYWAHEIQPVENTGERFLLLTGDCTGHGVPGAFMSLLNISILHEIISVCHISRPDLLLNAQREGIIMALNPEGAEEISKDGMDAVLCSFDFKNKELQFACANNPLWILRKGEMLEYKADKQPIGLHEGGKKDFTLQTVQLQPGDIVYTFTDGFADQFGGPKGKKFKLSHLKQVLISIGEQPLARQKEILEETFQSWRGNLEQVDDVLVIGVKIQ